MPPEVINIKPGDLVRVRESKEYVSMRNRDFLGCEGTVLNLGIGDDRHILAAVQFGAEVGHLFKATQWMDEPVPPDFIGIISVCYLEKIEEIRLRTMATRIFGERFYQVTYIERQASWHDLCMISGCQNTFTGVGYVNVSGNVVRFEACAQCLAKYDKTGVDSINFRK